MYKFQISCLARLWERMKNEGAITRMEILEVFSPEDFEIANKHIHQLINIGYIDVFQNQKNQLNYMIDVDYSTFMEANNAS